MTSIVCFIAGDRLLKADSTVSVLHYSQVILLSRTRCRRKSTAKYDVLNIHGLPTPETTIQKKQKHSSAHC